MTVSNGWPWDSLPSPRFPLYTRSNISETFPDVVTPLAATGQVWYGAEYGWRNGLIRFGAFEPDFFDPDNDELLGIFGGYGYLNVSVSRVLGVRSPGSDPAQVDFSYFGAQPGIPPYQARPDDVDPAATAKVADTIEWVLSADGLPELEEFREIAADLRRTRPDYAAMSNSQLASHAFGIQEKYFVPWVSTHFFLIYVGSVPIGGLAALTNQLGLPELFTALIGGFGEVDSAKPSSAMWDMGRLVAASPTLSAIFDNGVTNLEVTLRASDSPEVEAFVEAFDAFLFEYGSRGVNEWEMNTPTWQTHPAIALAAIGRMRLADESNAPLANLSRKRAEREDAIAVVRSKLGGDAAAIGQFEALLHAAEVFMPARERSKTTLVRMIGEVKVALRELGIRFTAAGHISCPEDVAMVTRQEFDDFVEQPDKYSDVIAQRNDELRELRKLAPPVIVNGVVPPIETWVQRGAATGEHAVEGTVLDGIGACSGSVTGPARIINDPSDADDLEPGEILVAPQTDPSWTPLFVSAAAVVVDVGAPMSHAAIVSRELGTPCVVSCTGATKSIRNGTIITVDGTAGRVTVVSAVAATV